MIAKSKEKTSNLNKKLSNLFDNSDIFIDMSSTLKSSLMSSYSFLIGFLFEPLLVEDDGEIIELRTRLRLKLKLKWRWQGRC